MSSRHLILCLPISSPTINCLAPLVSFVINHTLEDALFFSHKIPLCVKSPARQILLKVAPGMFLHTLDCGQPSEHAQVEVRSSMSQCLGDSKTWLIVTKVLSPEEKDTFCFLVSRSTVITEKAFFGRGRELNDLGPVCIFRGVNFLDPENLACYLHRLLTNQKKKKVFALRKPLTFCGLKKLYVYLKDISDNWYLLMETIINGTIFSNIWGSQRID